MVIVWALLVVAGLTTTWVVFSFERTEVAAWMAGAEPGHIVDWKLAGLSVAVGARVAGQADVGEVLVSGTVKDLVAGSGIVFDARGVGELKGLGEWPLYAVAGLG